MTDRVLDLRGASNTRSVRGPVRLGIVKADVYGFNFATVSKRMAREEAVIACMNAARHWRRLCNDSIHWFAGPR